jgi:hypothetical protein
MTIASIRSVGATTLAAGTLAGQEAAIAEPGAPQSLLQTAASSSLAIFVPANGLHPVAEQASADTSLARKASDAAVRGAGAAVGGGGARPMHDITFRSLSNGSSNDLR